jgi:hypothetical protein
MTEQIGQKVSFINSTESGNVRLEDQTEHEHSQFTRLVANWDTLSTRAKTKMHDLAVKHPSWVAELAIERQNLVLGQASETRSSQPQEAI